jgi:hypothetical protein
MFGALELCIADGLKCNVLHCRGPVGSIGLLTEYTMNTKFV